jgi:putative phosphoribosyl transferase
MVELPFRDRAQAGRLLGEALRSRASCQGSLVLALPRGGVPVGFEVAKMLGAPLDVVVVRKLGFPNQPELAMGAIASGGVRVLNEGLLGESGLYAKEIERIAVQEAHEVERREQLYRAGRPALELRGRKVVLVDDGLATGSTMLAAVECVRRLGASRVTVAVPVASGQAGERVRQVVDEYVCLATPVPFAAVGEWYDDFRQTSDAEVQEAMAQDALRRTEGNKPDETNAG